MIVLVATAAATLFMTGIGWLVQVVAYPLFGKVGDEAFVAYHSGWSSRITPVVFPPMLVELVGSGWLVAVPPPGSGVALAAAGLACALAAWISTAALQVPAHSKLASGFQPGAHRRLVTSSWVRTTAWSGHSAIACAMLLAA